MERFVAPDNMLVEESEAVQSLLLRMQQENSEKEQQLLALLERKEQVLRTTRNDQALLKQQLEKAVKEAIDAKRMEEKAKKMEQKAKKDLTLVQLKSFQLKRRVRTMSFNMIRGRAPKGEGRYR